MGLFGSTPFPPESSMTNKRKVNAKEVLKDLRSGMDDAALMERYNLSSLGFESLFTKLLKTGLITQEEFDDRMMPFGGTMTIGEDMEAFALPAKEQEDRGPAVQAAGLRKKKWRPPVKARDMVNDIRDGLNDAQLMEKYDLSAKGLQSVFTKLLEANALRRQELDRRIRTGESTVDVGNLTDGRALARATADLGPVGDQSEPISQEIVADFSAQSTGVVEEEFIEAAALSRPTGTSAATLPRPPEKPVPQSVDDVEPRPSEPQVWFEKPAFVILLLILLLPFGLYALYRTRDLSRSAKVVIVALVVFLLVVTITLPNLIATFGPYD
jgi:uncharacterized protein (DUF433 family)